MDEKQKLKKKLRSIMIVMLAIILPGLLRFFDSTAFELVRQVDIAMIYVAGIATGVFIVTARNYLKL